MDEEYHQEVKIVLMGNSGVGKTSMINQYLKNTFHDKQGTTVGAMFLTKMIEVNDKTYKLQIWDTAGQEKFRAIAGLYYRDAQGIILVYDVTKQASLDGLEVWMGDVNNKAEESVIKCVCGNKIDLVEYQEVDLMEGEKFARKHNASHLGTSAKTGVGIEEAFKKIVERIESEIGNNEFYRATEAVKIDNVVVKEQDKKKKKKKKCCK